MTSKTYTAADLEAAAVLMDDDLREAIHSDFPRADEPDAFLREYIRRHEAKFNGEQFRWA